MKHVFLLTMVLLLLTACGKDDHLQEIQQYVEAVKGRPPLPIEPIPPIQTIAKFTYPNSIQRNPFAPIINKVVSGQRPDDHRPKEPLEVFPLDSLRMVGTLYRDNQLWAIVTAPNDMVYRVKSGNYLGQNYGEITHITKEKIQVVETILNGNTWEKRSVILNLPKEE